MSDIVTEFRVPLGPDEAFDIFVNQMDVWWPRQGVFPYSFAPESTHARHIRFEPELDGRYYEEFADGTEYEIGRITAWEPGEAISYTWQDPTWPGSVTFAVTFRAENGGTIMRAEVGSFAEAGVPALAAFYAIGNRQTFAGYAAHCEAVAALRALQPA